MIISKYIEKLAVLTHYGINEMIRMEFNTYDDGTYYFLYVTEEVRIETNGADGLQMETHDSRVRDLGDPFQYLTIKERKDEYFNESLSNSYIELVIEAVEILYSNLNQQGFSHSNSFNDVFIHIKTPSEGGLHFRSDKI